MADLQLILIDIMTICFAIFNAFPQQMKTWGITNLMTCLVQSHHDSPSLMVDNIRIGKNDVVLILGNYASKGWNICLLSMVVKYSKYHQKYLRFWHINFDYWDDWELVLKTNQTVISKISLRSALSGFLQEGWKLLDG